MKRLSRDAFDRARQFLRTESRPLERALFEVHFEATSAARVAEELATFQNEDGGFGKALEPDLRTPSSSALSTSIGLRILKDLRCPAGLAMVRRAVQYLLNTFDDATRVWRVAPRDANDHPHAPWWHEENGSLARTFDNYVINPRAELMGLLHHYAVLVPDDWLFDVTEDTVAAIEAMEPLGTGGGDDLSCAIRLAETGKVPDHFRERLVNRIRAAVPTVVCRDAKAWNTYCITPLKLAQSPQSLAADLLWDDLQQNLDFVIEQQNQNGCWEPVWSWGECYPEAWELARQEWRGWLTLDNLLVLGAFGRIEP